MAERAENAAAIRDVALEAETGVRTDAGEEEKQEEGTPSETEGETTQPSLSEVKDRWKKRSNAVGKRRPDRPGKAKHQRSKASADDDGDESVEEPPDDSIDRDLTHVTGIVATTRGGSGGNSGSRPGAFAVTETSSSQWNNVASPTGVSAVSPNQRGHGRGKAASPRTQPPRFTMPDWAVKKRGHGRGKAASPRTRTPRSTMPEWAVKNQHLVRSPRLAHKSSSTASDRSAAASATAPRAPTSAAPTTNAGANALSADAAITETDAIDEMALADQVPRGTAETEAGANVNAECDNPSDDSGFPVNDSSSAPFRPGAYAVDGMEPSYGRRVGPRPQRPLPQDSDDLDVEEGQGQGQQEIMVEARLVMPNEEEAVNVDQPTSEGNVIARASSVVVVAEQLKCGMNFQDHRVRMSLCLTAVAFAALAIGLGIALGKNGNLTTTVETEKDRADGSNAIGTFYPSIDASAYPSAEPTWSGSFFPSIDASAYPSTEPTWSGTFFPSIDPSVYPSVEPTSVLVQQLIATTCWGLDYGATAGDERHGQSFTAVSSGRIKRIRMALQLNGDELRSSGKELDPVGKIRITIFKDAGFGGEVLGSIKVLPSYGSGSVTPMETFNLLSEGVKVNVESGSIYTIGLALTYRFESGGWCGTLDDVYAGGEAWFNEKAYKGAEGQFEIVMA